MDLLNDLYLFYQNNTEQVTWMAIAFCITQSAMFSGLNLAFFSLSRLDLEMEVERGNRRAKRILSLRKDSNFLLATILWGNVGINVLLTMLSDSVLAGVSAFFFSTVVITLLGEIIPQAYFSRNAEVVAYRLAYALRFYQLLLFPLAKTSALLLDGWLGKEGINYLREKDIKAILRAHITAEETDVEQLEGTGALNFLSIDDASVKAEGEIIDAASIIALNVNLDLPVIPAFEANAKDHFLTLVHKSKKKWVILTDLENEPFVVMDADGFLRAVMFDGGEVDPYDYCHRPIIVRDASTNLGEAINDLKHMSMNHHDVLNEDTILYWTDDLKKIITGADILGRLLLDVHLPIEKSPA